MPKTEAQKAAKRKSSNKYNKKTAKLDHKVATEKRSRRRDAKKAANKHLSGKKKKNAIGGIVKKIKKATVQVDKARTKRATHLMKSKSSAVRKQGKKALARVKKKK